MLTGKNLIDGEWVDSDTRLPSADLEGIKFAQATGEQIDQACKAARRDFRAYSGIPREDRASFLETIANRIDELGDDITRIAMKESGLPEARLVGERGRTVGQLRMFASLIREPDYLDQRHDPGGRMVLRKPSTNSWH